MIAALRSGSLTAPADMLVPGTLALGLAMNASSSAASQVRPEPAIAAE